jgi:UDP-N-acetylglucosamine--N-acetylmuramyl-(pentapeptide) pyrophosphoryl-undecaprenol N-acetylglucosamine transferase
MKNVLFFTSPIGLGHASRDIIIASKLDSNITFVTGEGATRLISDYGFKVKDLYRHDGFEVDERGELKHALRWLMNYWSYYKKCKVIAENIIKESKPDLVISDEDFASIAVAQQLGIPNVIITDVLQTQFTKGPMSFIEKRMNASMQKMISNSNCVIIPAEGQGHDNINYVGPVVRDVSSDRESLRKRFGFGRKTILVTIGGTDSGKFLVDKTVETYSKIKDAIDADLFVVSGPSLNIDAKKEGIKHIGYTTNLHEMIYACDLLISLAGRSTIDEATSYGTPSIFIPIKNHFEQEENAKRYGYRFEDIDRLEDLVAEKLDKKRSEIVIRNGAKRASSLILNLLT